VLETSYCIAFQIAECKTHTQSERILSNHVWLEHWGLSWGLHARKVDHILLSKWNVRRHMYGMDEHSLDQIVAEMKSGPYSALQKDEWADVAGSSEQLLTWQLICEGGIPVIWIVLRYSTRCRCVQNLLNLREFVGFEMNSVGFETESVGFEAEFVRFEIVYWSWNRIGRIWDSLLDLKQKLIDLRENMLDYWHNLLDFRQNLLDAGQKLLDLK
jgi:hypothetical protein